MLNFLKKKTDHTKQEAQAEKPVQEKENTKSVIKNPKTYFEKSIEAAEKGNVIASAYVGVSYHYGIEVGDEKYPEGLEPNHELAIKYLSMAAEKDYLKAQIDLGFIYFDKNSPAFDMYKALEWMAITAKKGDPLSQYILGHYYNTGEYLPKDDVKAYHWLLESSYNGCESAMVELGKIYQEKTSKLLNHDGDVTDEQMRQAKGYASLAAKWFEKAAELGEEEAFFCIAVCYFAGYGVEENEEKSLRYLNLAIENGFEAAIDFKNKHFA